jgi:flagellar FliL protein
VTPRLNDTFSTFLRELRPEDLAGSQGTYELRMEILKRVNLIAAPAEVKAVLIEEMLITG